MNKSWQALQTFLITTIFFIGQLVIAPSVAWADAELTQAMLECKNNPSKTWDSQRNMCVTTKESKQTRDDVRACAELEGEAQKACHDRIAEEKTGVTAGSEDGKDPLMIISFLGAAMTGVMMVASKKMAGGSTCISLYIMGAASLGGLAAEFLYKKGARTKLKELAENYKEEATIDDPYLAQKRAFEYLKEEQLAISELSDVRFKSYLAVAAGYAAAAVVAIMESTGAMGMKKCGGEEAESEAPESEVAETPGGEAGSTTTADATGVGADASTDLPGPADAAAGNELVGGAVGPALGGPMGIAIVSGIGAAVTGFLAKKAYDQIGQSKDQADRIQAIIDGFDNDFSSFCPQGREDLNNPQCYCYNADGTENKKRTNSQICQNLWAQRNRNLAVRAGNYNATGAKVARQGCFFVNGQFDPDCRCKDVKNNKGDNACVKVGMPMGVSGSLSQALTLPEVMADLNKMVDGQFSAGRLDGAALSQRAANIDKVRRKVFDDYSKNPNNKQKFPSDEKILDNILARASQAVMSSVSPDPLLSASRFRPDMPALKAALESANMPAETSATPAATSSAYKKDGGALNAKGKAKKAGDDFQFDFSSGGNNSGVIGGFMEQDYNYGGNDISSRNDVSLWEVISHRYVQTGLRRLFGGDDIQHEDQTSETHHERE